MNAIFEEGGEADENAEEEKEVMRGVGTRNSRCRKDGEGRGVRKLQEA